MATAQQQAAETLNETRARLEAFLPAYFCARLAALRHQIIEVPFLDGTRDDHVSRCEP